MTWSHHPALDGLRSIAVYLVLLFHTGLGWVGGGFVGVDLFFVLSGFLVTTVIVSEIDETGTLRIGRFYARRVRRLLPAALATIVATSLAFLLVTSVVRRIPLVGDAQSALLYIANWRFSSQSTDYFAADVQESPFLHFWSLAIEEQFYLVFPLLLVALARGSRGRTTRLVGGLGVLLALSLTAQLLWAQVDPVHAYYGTDARLYQLLAGALLAIGIRSGAEPRRRPPAAWATLVGMTGLLVLGSGIISVTPSVRGLAVTVAATLLVWGLVRHDRTPIARLLSRSVPVWLGRVSYGTYLWHWPVIVLLETVLVVDPLVIAAASAVLATSLAALSYELLEMPIRRSAGLSRFTWHVAGAGMAASLLVAATIVPVTLTAERRPVLAAAAAGTAVAAGAADASVDRTEEVPADVDWAEVDADVGVQRWCPGDEVAGCVVRRGSGPHVLVIGDSQAQMLGGMFTAMAEEHDLTLSFNILAGCLWQEGLVNTEASSDSQQRCTQARSGWYEQALPRLDPDVVVLVGRPRDDVREWSSVVRRRDGHAQPLQQAVLQSTRETLATIERLGARALLVERLVMPETFDPADCLASAPDAGDCAVAMPTDVADSDAYYLTVAAESSAVFTANLNPAFCPAAPVCAPVIDGEVVWRDDHHVTARYATARADEAWQLIEQTGVLGRGR